MELYVGMNNTNGVYDNELMKWLSVTREWNKKIHEYIVL